MLTNEWTVKWEQLLTTGLSAAQQSSIATVMLQHVVQSAVDDPKGFRPSLTGPKHIDEMGPNEMEDLETVLTGGTEAQYQLWAKEDLQSKIDAGSDRDDAQLLTVIAAGDAIAKVFCLAWLAASKHSTAFASIIHSTVEAVWKVNHQCTAAPPKVLYATLYGVEEFESPTATTLANCDPAWIRLALGLVSIGESFTTNVDFSLCEPTEHTFPNAQGLYYGEVTGPDLEDFEYQLQDTDIVGVISTDADHNGYHTPWLDAGPDPDERTWNLPIDTTITLQDIKQPGTWSAHGHSIQRN